MENNTIISKDNIDFFMDDCGEYFVGKNRKGETCFAFRCNQNSQENVVFITKKISLEYNALVYDSKSNNKYKLTVLTYIEKDYENEKTFIDLCRLLIVELNHKNKEEITEDFYLLNKFFNNKIKYTDIELQGLFAELYTIRNFKTDLHLEHFWQSEGMMNFDFSFDENTKLEIKSTLKQKRIHHFKHNQLTTNKYNIKVLSYMLQKDDFGLSLYDLLVESIEIMQSYPKKLFRLKKYIFDIDKDTLKAISFNEQYLLENIKLFNAIDVPKFNEISPEGVSNAEYDCVLDNIVGFSGIDIKIQLETLISNSKGVKYGDK